MNSRGSRPIIDGVKRPRISEGIVSLTSSESDVGNFLYSRLSAVAHVTWFGIHWALDTASAEADDHAGMSKVAIGTDGVQVSMIGFYLVKALREAAIVRFTLMGWNDSEWQNAVSAVRALENIFATTVLRAQGQT